MRGRGEKRRNKYSRMNNNKNKNKQRGLKPGRARPMTRAVLRPIALIRSGHLIDKGEGDSEWVLMSCIHQAILNEK